MTLKETLAQAIDELEFDRTVLVEHKNGHVIAEYDGRDSLPDDLMDSEVQKVYVLVTIDPKGGGNGWTM